MNQSPAPHVDKKTIERNRQRLLDVLEGARASFRAGHGGLTVAHELARSLDRLLIELIEEQAAQVADTDVNALKRSLAVVAVGGSGRGDLAPYSDVDLLFLHPSGAAQVCQPFVASLVRTLWDAGMKLGHSVRTVSGAIKMALEDPVFTTTLVESRLLWGSQTQFARLERRYKSKVVDARKKAFTESCIDVRAIEREQFGDAVTQLSPEIKRSPGGLRDLHLVRWISFCRFGTTNFRELRDRGALANDDYLKLSDAWEYLTRIRLEMHFHAGKKQDVLTRSEQLRLAKRWQIPPTEGQLPVERFMQTYFLHTTAVHEIASRFAELQAPQSFQSRLFSYLLSHKSEHGLRIGQQNLLATAKSLEPFCQSVEGILRLYKTACLYNVQFDPALLDTVSKTVPGLPALVSQESAEMFLEILSGNGSMSKTLRSMFRTRVLDILIPHITRTRGLLQFNLYHSYTVDEHTLRAIEACEKFSQDEESPVGAVYREIQRKHILHLALLLHDLGKGYAESHAEIGAAIADDIASRLGLNDHERDLLVFLVHKHLTMAHTAFRRDITDPQEIIQFARNVGSPEALRMLYVLTAADLQAVGPGVWNDWKADLLTDLYARAMLQLTGKQFQFHEEQRIAQVKQLVLQSIAPLGAEVQNDVLDSIEDRLSTFSANYLLGTTPDQIAADMDVLSRIRPEDVHVELTCDVETQMLQCRIYTHEEHTSGCFHKVAGVFAAKRWRIVSAEIHTSTDGFIVDVYHIEDLDYVGEIPQFRMDEVEVAIRQVLNGDISPTSLFPKTFSRLCFPARQDTAQLPTRVVIDNESSCRCTIIDAFAHDQPGLLYVLSRAIYQMGLSVMLAKIATYHDQVVDVFYVTDQQNHKIDQGHRLAEIRDQLQACLIDFDGHGDPRRCFD